VVAQIRDALTVIATAPPEIAAPAPDRRLQRRSRQEAAELYRWYLLAAQAAAEGHGRQPQDPARRRPGRPSKLRPDIVGRFLGSVRLGNRRETAARFAGINPATMYRWLKDPRPECRTFRELLDRAEAEAEAEVTENLYRMTRTNAQAAIYWLTRRYPERWGDLPVERTRRPRTR
jgi:hypothetical protein